ncbi:M23 family metallopeptidase [Nocardioides sp. TRM66260-LWL]|uniref:murein hydrolase activator EnvC family protein n=1 Tax=Nocardioides sp. TRM66260-LWL TaxID=2874478 RepID=UPI001CC554B8|nr:M23 family metallopeptidase [Nocardioides sp. TRM66260-LWL]MBZ5733178.1 M23 family metallopeptidase [Nocardioides sp. TRM66260-LWL]
MAPRTTSRSPARTRVRSRLDAPAVRLLAAALVGTVACAPTSARADGPAPAGGASWPLAPSEVVRRFEAPPDPYAAGHRGVDLLGRTGDPVHAARAGRVLFAGPLAGRGVLVVGHDDGTRTTYEPVAAAVARGDAVPEGALIGRLEAAPSHCAPRACLHWGWRRGETYLDPLTLLGAGPVRLLPLDGGRPTRALTGSSRSAPAPTPTPTPTDVLGSALTASAPGLGFGVVPAAP